MNKSNSKVIEQIAEIDITPMLDVVFILLIFFIVTSNFTREVGIGVNFHEKTPHASLELSPIVVSVMPAGQIQVDQRMVSKFALSSMIRSLLAEKYQRSIVVQVEKGAKLGMLVTVLDRIRLAGRELPTVQVMD